MKILSAAILIACVPLSAAAISSSRASAASSLPTCQDLAKQAGWVANNRDFGIRAFMKAAFFEGRCQRMDGTVHQGARSKKKVRLL
jgi:hypothetical protein